MSRIFPNIIDIIITCNSPPNENRKYDARFVSKIDHYLNMSTIDELV